MSKKYYPSQHELIDTHRLERVTRDIYDRIYNLEKGGPATTVSTAVASPITRSTTIGVLGGAFHAQGVFPPAGSPSTNPTYPSVTTVTSGTTTLYPANDIILCDASGGAVTLNLPAVTTNLGKLYEIKKIDTSANTVTIDPSGAEEIEGDTTLQLSFFSEAVTIICDATQWWII